MQTKALWFLFFFVSTEAFAFRQAEWGGLGFNNIGWFGLTQLMLLGITVIAAPRGLRYLYRNRRTAIGCTALLIGLLPLYLVLVTMFRGAFTSGIVYREMLTNLVSAKGLIFVFLLAYLISQKNGFKAALSAISVYSLVSAVSVIVILVFDIETAVFEARNSSDVTRFFRAVFPTGFLVAVGWILFLSRYIALGGVSNIVASMLCLTATVVQMHRSVLSATLVTSLALILWVVFSRKQTDSRQKFWVVTILLVVGIIFMYFVFAENSIIYRYFLASTLEFQLGDGNTGHRFNIIANSWSFALSNTIGFGLGLDWERVQDMFTYLKTSFVAGPTLDSSYANIVISSGIPGMALYMLFVVSIFRMSSLRAMRGDTPVERSYALFLRMFLIFSLVVGLGTDLVLLTSASTVFSLSLVVAVELQNRRSRRGYTR